VTVQFAILRDGKVDWTLTRRREFRVPMRSRLCTQSGIMLRPWTKPASHPVCSASGSPVGRPRGANQSGADLRRRLSFDRKAFSLRDLAHSQPYASATRLENVHSRRGVDDRWLKRLCFASSESGLAPWRPLPSRPRSPRAGKNVDRSSWAPIADAAKFWLA